MAEDLDDQDIFAVFEQDDQPEKLKKNILVKGKRLTASSFDGKPQIGDKRELKDVLADPILFDEDEGQSTSKKKIKLEDTERYFDVFNHGRSSYLTVFILSRKLR